MNWGILATGTIANKFATTVNAMAAEGERLAAVGSRRAESAKAFAAQYNIPHWYASYEELAADPAVDAIYIATPNTLHYENCKLCLEHGKHVLCEKPFTINAEQAKELYALAEKKQLFIMEAFWIRFLPLYAKLQQMLSDGLSGTLQTITCQYGFTTEGARRERKFNSALGGGALLDIGIYNLGFLQMVTGQQPQNVQTEELRLTEYGTDEYSKLRLAYPSGCTAESVQTLGQRLTRMACIVGTKGRITLPDFQYAEHMTLELDGQPPQELDFPFDVNGFEYQIREVSRCAATGRHHSSIYTPQQSIALTQLMYDIRMAWGMKFEGEE